MLFVHLIFGLIVAWLSRLVRGALPSRWRERFIWRMFSNPDFGLRVSWLIIMFPALIVGIWGSIKRNAWLTWGGFTVFAVNLVEFVFAIFQYRRAHPG